MSFSKLFSPGLLVLAVAMFISQGAHAETITISSPVEQATLLELYTSEGCSSCPPADRWLSRLKTDKNLWQKVVPVAFHVDYWDYLGWRDRFSDARYSKRQANYKRHNYVKVVYTPGLFNNGREFRGWYRGDKLYDRDAKNVGILKTEITDNQASVTFNPTQPIRERANLHVALLAFDQKTEVAAGENHGRQLIHDFVVLDLKDYQADSKGDTIQWTIDRLADNKQFHVTGIALWVTAGNDPTPIQATGGWLR